MRQGANDYRGIGYAGPCPPPNAQAISSNMQQLRGLTRQKPHKYSFTIYALDVNLDLAAGANKNELLEAMDGHIVASGELAGEYVNKILYKQTPGPGRLDRGPEAADHAVQGMQRTSSVPSRSVCTS